MPANSFELLLVIPLLPILMCKNPVLAIEEVHAYRRNTKYQFAVKLLLFLAIFRVAYFLMESYNTQSVECEPISVTPMLKNSSYWVLTHPNGEWSTKLIHTSSGIV